MVEYICNVRVPYSDTDVMGYLHHSNYARYYETARWEMFRDLGIPYKEIEDAGCLLPVISMDFKFVRPAVYDDLLTVKTNLKKLENPRITFVYKMYNEKREIVNKAEVNLAFVDKKTRKICDVPEFIREAILCAKSNNI